MNEILDHEWDVIVIGAGLGGGICGRALAEAGLSVLFIEKGPASDDASSDGQDAAGDDPASREAAGCWPLQVEARVEGVITTSWGAQGVGVGGTSLFYAAAMEQPERHDMDVTAGMPHPIGGWPVGYDEFQPWYDRARSMMAVNGTPDPLSDNAVALAPPRPLAARDAALETALREAGLSPYRAHLGIRQIIGCTECIGHKCPMNCKMDGRSAGVVPALATGRAAVLDAANVIALEGGPRRVTGVRLRRHGAEHVLSARAYVMAAGAFGSPRLLMASKNDHWPHGCANSSGMVGRGLMFHVNERIAIWPPRDAPPSSPGPRKCFSIRDLYREEHLRFGILQSLGLPATYGNVLFALRQGYASSRFPKLRLMHELLRIPAFAAAHVLGEARVFAAIIEDLPDEANRVVFDPARPDTIIYEYTVSDELKDRRRRFRRLLKRRLRGLRSIWLNFSPELNVAHPCGTLRFSDDPARGVLDRDCRAHDVDNLYVADASFMPSSTGVNPGLTIVANALRVADALGARLKHE
ncbi:GMC oxidoreductase [Paracoccus rhizosphaerae]|uniref:GMC oxidoreductase n=1 Tax=Paracoccus rhizosphaerae TaxID=1133347 RepID=A0ABV6CHT5_9RHOB|nr:GMC family oxidoreductase [Paracoccus rhizosphaerae]